MRSKRYHGRWFSVFAVPNDALHHRLGLVVAKRLTRTSVSRNAVKRMVREVFRTGAEAGEGTVRRDVVVQLRTLPVDLRAGREELADLLEKAAGLTPPK